MEEQIQEKREFAGLSRASKLETSKRLSQLRQN